MSLGSLARSRLGGRVHQESKDELWGWLEEESVMQPWRCNSESQQHSDGHWSCVCMRFPAEELEGGRRA